MNRIVFFTAMTLLGPMIGLAEGILQVMARGDTLELRIDTRRPDLHIVEIDPAPASRRTNVVATVPGTGRTRIRVPRHDGSRDRIYSAFALSTGDGLVGAPRFVEEWRGVSLHRDAYPKTSSKKGLQVQMLDDAIALGVKHAALNLNFGSLVSLRPQTNDFTWTMDGREFRFRRSYVERMDESVKRLSDAGMTVTLILLFYKSSDDAINQVLLHPGYDEACPERLSAFNTVTPEGVAWFKACVEFLAARYSRPGAPHGRVVNYIVGNEVNAHWWWANMGRVSMETFADDYLRTVRLCHAAVRKFSASARVFVSLEHHWTIPNPGGDAMQTFPGRAFLDYFAKQARAAGDFDWHLAYHPYPENLFECRTWNDGSARPDFDTPRITFKNIELLPRYLRRAELLYRGRPRHIILSEQGFHSPDHPQGEIWQAAAYCYAYYKIDRIDGIDSFILHRHVDHKAEGGLNLGLWTRNPASAAPSDPLRPKLIYDVFRAADTPEWREMFNFALPVIGQRSWDEILPKGPADH